MKFGEYLREARDKTGWTQPEAAAKIGIEQSYLSKMETGKSYPSEEIFDELVKAYDINVDTMSASVSSEELDKLREIGSVRAAVLQQQKTETGYLRSWMVAGLIMIMLGAGALIGQSEVNTTVAITHRYESPGIILPGESILVFEQLANQGHYELKACQKRNTSAGATAGENCQEILDRAKETVAARTEYDILDSAVYLGPEFVRTGDDGNRRRYELVNKMKSVQQTWINYLHAIGIALLLGGIVSCFYISRNWR